MTKSRILLPLCLTLLLSLKANSEEINLQPVSGKVVDEQGSPIPDCVVWITHGNTYQTVTDQDGNFTIKLQHRKFNPTQSVFIRANQPGVPDKVAWTIVAKKEMELFLKNLAPPHEGKAVFSQQGIVEISDIILRMEPACTINGKVFDFENKPCPEAKLSLAAYIHLAPEIVINLDTKALVSNEELITDPDGSYEIRGLIPLPKQLSDFPGNIFSQYDISCTAPKNQRFYVRLSDMEDGLQINRNIKLIKWDAGISGTAHNYQGEPLSGYEVFIGMEGLPQYFSCTTDKNGKFMRKSMPSTSKLKVTFSGYKDIYKKFPVTNPETGVTTWQAKPPEAYDFYPRTVKFINTSVEQNQFSIDFVVEKPKGKLSVTVLSPEGTPAKYFPVQYISSMASCYDWRRKLCILTDKNGKAEFENLPIDINAKLQFGRMLNGNFLEKRGLTEKDIPEENSKYAPMLIPANMAILANKNLRISMRYKPGESGPETKMPTPETPDIF